MKIINASKNDLSAKERYMLTMSPKTQKMSEQVGSIIPIAAWCEFLDTKEEKKDGVAVMENGVPKMVDETIFSIVTPDGETFATNSATLMKDFHAMLDCFKDSGEELKAIEIISGTSNKGREFITCAYAEV